MTADDVQAWLDRYLAAWRSYDPGAIADLFTEDVVYRYHPYDDPPVTGRHAVVESWLESDRVDEPETWAAHYEPFAVDGDRAVAVGVSTYLEHGRVARVYDNVFTLRFGADGRCAEFTEWYVQRPDA